MRATTKPPPVRQTPLPFGDTPELDEGIEKQLYRLRILRQRRELATHGTESEQVDTMRNTLSAVLVRLAEAEEKYADLSALAGKLQARVNAIDCDLLKIYDLLARAKVSPHADDVVTWGKLQAALRGAGNG